MYYPNSARTAIEVIASLMEEVENEQVLEACRSTLQMAAPTETLFGVPNEAIVRLCEDKNLAEQATAAAVLFRRAARHAALNEVSYDFIRFNCCEGLMWGASAVLYAEMLVSMAGHPSAWN